MGEKKEIARIDSLSALILSVFNNKGVYALLLGSGISVEAKIMSGWSVTEDLIKKVAVAQGEDIPKDPFKWYKEKYGVEAEYSSILEQLGKKPSEMESLLKPYFEPSEEDEEQGYKKPTKAHEAIAEMAKRGYFKLIITTNFDKLLETALDAQNVKYQMISHEDVIEASVPLYHQPLTLLKINGDYKDCRFRNTEKELSKYPEEMVSYMKPVLKNFGLLTCGWSAKWDIALVKMIGEESSHRYSYYFSYLGDNPGDIGILAEKCKGETIKIEGADDLFTEMNERLKALETINEKNMELDAEVAIARIKDYIPDSKKVIKYSDLFERMTNKVLADVKPLVYGDEYPTGSLFERVMAENLSVLSVILSASVVAIKWADEMHYDAIIESLERIANRKIVKPMEGYSNSYPLNRTVDTVYLYGLGMACVAYKKFALLDKLFRIKFDDDSGLFSPYIIDKDNLWIMDETTWNNSNSSMNYKTPFSTHLCNMLRPYFPMLNTKSIHEAVFCIFEMLLAMYYYMLISKQSNFDDMCPPMGAFVWSPYYLERSGCSAYQDFFEEIEQQQSNSLVIKAGMFEGRYDLFKEIYDKVEEYRKQYWRG